MARPVCLLTNPIEPTATRRLAEHCTVNTLEQTDADTIRAAARTAQIVIVRTPLPDDLFDTCPSLIAAIRHGAGVDMIPLAARVLRSVGIPMNCPRGIWRTRPRL